MLVMNTQSICTSRRQERLRPAVSRVLFVDDEALTLRAIRRMMARYRPDWEMDFVGSGARALEALASSPYDAVVSDMVMPGMTGLQLLEQVKARYPRVARIILTAYTPPPAVLHASSVVHRFLWKPASADELVGALEMIFAAQSLVEDPVLRDRFGDVGALPALPSTYQAVQAALRDPSSGISDVADLVAADPSMSAKLLQLVSSAFFGRAPSRPTVRSAVSFLGVRRVRALVLTIGLFEVLDDVPRSFDVERFGYRAVQVAALAQRIPPERSMQEDAFTAGLLHDLGWLLLIHRFPEQAELFLERATAGECCADVETVGVSHAEAGAYLFALWGLDAALVEATLYHHFPALTGRTSFGLVDAVHVAEALLGGGGAEQACGGVQLDTDHIESLGMSARLAGWRALVG